MTDIQATVEIRPFSDELAHYFTALNMAWLQKYFAPEPIDIEMLGDPKKYFIGKGGYIFFACTNDMVLGTFALLKLSDHEYELSKMAVAENFRGMKVGSRLMEYCITKARELKAKKIILYSNTLLEPAIHLYKKYGFLEVPVTGSGYVRSNIKMELEIG